LHTSTLSTHPTLALSSSLPTPPLRPSPTRRSSDLTPLPIGTSKSPTGTFSLRSGLKRPYSPLASRKITGLYGLFSPERSEKVPRSEEHTSELQSRFDLVCRLLLEKKNKTNELNQIT